MPRSYSKSESHSKSSSKYNKKDEEEKKKKHGEKESQNDNNSQYSQKKKKSYEESGEEDHNARKSESSVRTNRSNRSASKHSDDDTIYFTNISIKLKDSTIEKLFESYKGFKEINIVRDPYTKESRGFGFVYFDCQENAVECLNKMNGIEVEGKPLRLELAKRKRPREKTPGRLVLSQIEWLFIGILENLEEEFNTPHIGIIIEGAVRPKANHIAIATIREEAAVAVAEEEEDGIQAAAVRGIIERNTKEVKVEIDIKGEGDQVLG